MHSIVIAVDDPRRPKRSAIISGPDAGNDANRKAFNSFRSAKSNPTGLPWVLLIESDPKAVAQTPEQPQKKGKL